MLLHADVLVAGAGPAGAAAAVSLARAGHDVLVVDRARFPRPKLCGEFMSPDALDSLSRLGALPAVLALSPARMSTLRIGSPRAGATTRELGGGVALGLSRARLDAALVDHARSSGARVVENARATGFELQDNHVLARLDVSGVEGTARVRAVIDATGRHGLAAGSRVSRADDGLVGLRRSFRERDGCASQVSGVELHAFGAGYVGLAPSDNGRVNLCLLARATALRAAGSPEALLAHARDCTDSLRESLAPLEAADEPWLAVAGLSFATADPSPDSGVLAIGDAAGAIAPACGDGIGMALRAGELVAPVVSRHLEGELSFAAMRNEHASTWIDEFGSRLRAGRWLQAALLGNLRADALVLLARHARPLVTLAVAATRGPWSGRVLVP